MSVKEFITFEGVQYVRKDTAQLALQRAVEAYAYNHEHMGPEPRTLQKRVQQLTRQYLP